MSVLSRLSAKASQFSSVRPVIRHPPSSGSFTWWSQVSKSSKRARLERKCFPDTCLNPIGQSSHMDKPVSRSGQIDPAS